MSLFWQFRMIIRSIGYDNHIVNTLRIWDAEPIVDSS